MSMICVIGGMFFIRTLAHPSILLHDNNPMHFVHFHAFFQQKSCQIIGFFPQTQHLAPRLGNPRSATAIHVFPPLFCNFGSTVTNDLVSTHVVWDYLRYKSELGFQNFWFILLIIPILGWPRSKLGTFDFWVVKNIPPPHRVCGN